MSGYFPGWDAVFIVLAARTNWTLRTMRITKYNAKIPSPFKRQIPEVDAAQDGRGGVMSYGGAADVTVAEELQQFERGRPRDSTAAEHYQYPCIGSCH
ncbi:hypothetical protein LTR15_005344 [Elasticomyces elasticus]|nr:hypothetical protein LTR15_005344 [Elasticomyces elasticus]